MSIWSSLPAPCDDEAVEGWPVPYVWPGHSNRYPDESLERGGWVDIASIPAHVKFWIDNPDAAPHEEPSDGWDPNYLRLGVNESTVILDRAGVELVHRTLSEWLAGAKEPT